MSRLLILGSLVAFVFINIGCGGASLGETGISHFSDLATGAVNDAWYSYNKGNYTSAKSQFETVLRMDDLNSVQKSACYSGLGFAEAKMEGLIAAREYFSLALQEYDLNRDAKVGMAGYYLTLADKEYFDKGIALLESMGIQSSTRKYTPEYNQELTPKKVHSLLGLLYYYNGNYNDAFTQLRWAQEINEPYPDCDIKSVTDSFLSSLEGCLNSNGDVVVH